MFSYVTKRIRSAHWPSCGELSTHTKPKKEKGPLYKLLGQTGGLKETVVANDFLLTVTKVSIYKISTTKAGA